MACQGESLVVLNLKLLLVMFSESSGRIVTAKKWGLWLGGNRNYSHARRGDDWFGSNYDDNNGLSISQGKGMAIIIVR